MTVTTRPPAPAADALAAPRRRHPVRRVLVAIGVVLLLVLIAAGIWVVSYLTPDGPGEFFDDFDGAAGSAPDPKIWGNDVGRGGWGNNELQEYTSDATALDGEGNLVITATIPRDGSAITSGRLTTKGKFSFQYGTLETRMKLPGGQGLLPAFWMLGDTTDVVGWPAAGEIDIVETPSTTSASSHHVHGPVSFTKKWSVGEGVRFERPLSEDYHVFGVTRSPGHIEITVDGEVAMTVDRDDIRKGTWVFDLPMHALFSLAVGGDWPGEPDETTPEVAEMKIDWIRYTPQG
ncbi:glycoside hydrolase family 16 protein [Microbacterium rhizophilus]|uniref:glycoside hydrolase family 16 protein n=1 Tax=Microbacterium rhizophilus TaxID=3138934 RepID=UPI0031ED5118